MVQSIRQAVRALRVSPGFTTLAVLTLALGIAANSAIFGVTYGILLRPLPYRDADRLVIVQRDQNLTGGRGPVPVAFATPAEISIWQGALPSLESAAFYAPDAVALATATGAEVLDSAVVTASFFATLAGRMAAGSPLGPQDDLANGAVISHRLSQRLFGGPAAAPGRSLTLSSRPYIVLGVADSAFQFPAPVTDVWMPYGFARSVNPRCCAMRMLGRLKQHETAARAAQEAATLSEAPASPGATAGPAVRATIVGLRDQIVSAVRPGLRMLFAAAGLVLLAACVNVTNLMLTRQVARAREAAIRRALGASRGRLLADRLAEAMLLAAGGAVLGVALAISSVELVVSLGPASGLPRLDAIRVDAPVLLFSVALAGAVALLTSLMPAFRLASPAETLRSSGTYAATPASGRRIRGALCVTELAVALVLLVGVGLLGRSLVRLLQTDLGVTTERVTTASLNLAFGRRPPDAQVLDRIDRVIERIAALPGVEAAGVGTSLPPASSRIRLTLRRAGDAVDYQAAGVAATPGYFDALGFRLVKGRLFTAQDDLNHPHVMIMSVDTARRFFADGDPIDRTISLPSLRDGVNKAEEMTLVGVVANVRYSGLAVAPGDAVYRPFAQQPWVAPFLVARTAQDSRDVLSVIRREIAAVDPAIVVADVRPLDALVSDATTQPRFRTALLTGIAGLAMLVAAVGLFGVVAQSVSQRTREIGIRMALGANRAEIRRMVLREGAWLGLAGVILGVPAAFLAARALTGLLYGVAPADVPSFAFASAALLAVSLAAAYIPAARAARVDPLVALRSE